MSDRRSGRYPFFHRASSWLSAPDATAKIRTEEEPADATLKPIARQGSELPSAKSVHPLTLDFLAWLASSPRSYAEAMEAWRTSCPRYSIWEDALGDGLIRLESGDGMTMSQTKVILTPRGRALLDGK